MASSTAKPLVLVVTGTSGAGKGTLEKILLERMPEVELAVSATTREQRPGEQNGREYWFITPEKFEQLVEDGEFLEYVDLPWGARSGTLRSEIDRIQANGKVPLLDLETDGALRVQDAIPGSVTIFVDAPTFAELERRLRERATESSGEIQVRLDLARKQQTLKDRFDYVIVNDEVELAVSATTREHRPGEQNGREYWFITPEKFEGLVDEGEFLEYVDLPWGARSGTLRSEIDRIQANGKVPLLDLETDGALRVQEAIPESVTIFVDAPTFEEL